MRLQFSLMHNTELIYGVRFHLQWLNITLSSNLTSKTRMIILKLSVQIKLYQNPSAGTAAPTGSWFARTQGPRRCLLRFEVLTILQLRVGCVASFTSNATLCSAHRTQLTFRFGTSCKSFILLKYTHLHVQMAKIFSYPFSHNQLYLHLEVNFK